MAVDGKVLRIATERFERDKAARAAKAERRRQQIYRDVPRIREIEGELRATMSQIISGALQRGTDPLPAIRVIRDKNLALQQERQTLLQRYGYAPDALDDAPACPLCGDSGYVRGGMCRCLKKYYHDAQIAQLSQLLDLGHQSFDTFSFDWYSPLPDPELGISPRRQMEDNYDLCRDFANQFSRRSGSLLLTGEPGLGKTFLSACIARVVSEGGHSVVYDTAGHVFSVMESVKFGREEEDEARRYDDCDLLILDDLGTELTTAFVQSALYQLVNGRLMAGKSTVISTNLTLEELGAKYGRQVQSRLEGEYRVLPFFGEDIRLQKAAR